MKKVLIMLMLMLMLNAQGCVPGVLVAGGAVAGGVAADPRSVDTIRYDEKINFAASSRLGNDHELAENAHINVVSYNRVVLLTGQAPRAELKSRALDLVKDLPHVKKLFNQITIGEPIAWGQRSKDTTITANIRARLLATTNLKSAHFKVVTENATVYLLGLASAEQANIAATIVRDSSGVERVVKLIEILPA